MAVSTANAGAPSGERIVSLPALAGTPPDGAVWSPDSARLAFVWNDAGMPFRDIWVVQADSGPARRLTRLAPDSAPPPAPGQSLAEMRARVARRADTGIGRVVWTPDGSALVFAHQGRLLRVAVDGSAPGPYFGDVERAAGVQSAPVFSPDGGKLSWIEDFDLWMRDLADGAERRVTDSGTGPIGRVATGSYHRPDVEIARHAWSADGRWLAWQVIDRRAVRRVPIPSWLQAAEPFLHEVRRPYPGDRDRRVQLWVLDTDSGERRRLDLGPSRARVVHEFAWAPEAARLLIHLGSDVGEDRWIRVAEAATGEVREVWHDRRARRIYPAFRAVWSADGGRIVYVGDSDAHYRLYAIDAAGGSPRPLTRDDFDVAGSAGAAALEVVGAEPMLYFTGAADSPYERHLYRIDADDPRRPRRITRLAGVHEPVAVAPDGQHYASVASTDTRPAELYIGRSDGSGPERRVTDSPPGEFADYDWIEARYTSFPSRIDDYTLHARIVEPRELEPGMRYPVLIGNIYSNTVRRAFDRRRPTSLFQQRLALAGDYIHVQVDLRGSIGYGVDFREAFQGDWGRGDLEDLVSTVEYLETLEHVDPERIGLWGNSYGGLMVLAALFRKPGRFAAGVAGAPAVDVWHFTGYDQHLTRRPDTHPDIFEQGSLLDLGEDLRDPLLIIHGMHDDIVPYKTTLMMTDKLMMLGKDFDLISMPDAPHWWASPEHYGVYTFGKLEAFLRRHVPPGPRPAAAR